MTEKAQQDAWIQVRCPLAITSVLKMAAKARNMTASDYVRTAVEKEIKRDGLSVAA
jgi:uncharacterized protein (DUF1778 family)